MKNNDFYRINAKLDSIKIIDDHAEVKLDKIFAENDNTDCCICLDNEKYYVFIPCGHYYVCKYCYPHLHNCPLCRKNILQAIPFSELRM